MKSVIKALSGPRLATPLTDAEDGAKETDRNLIDDFSEELPPNESSSSVSQGNEHQDDEEILYQSANRVSPFTTILGQEVPSEDVRNQFLNPVGFDNGNPRGNTDITDKTAITPLYNKEAHLGFDAISGNDPKSEENFVPVKHSRSRLTGQSVNLSQEGMVVERLSTEWASTQK
jgi:hypothetical protein